MSQVGINALVDSIVNRRNAASGGGAASGVGSRVDAIVARRKAPATPALSWRRPVGPAPVTKAVADIDREIAALEANPPRGNVPDDADADWRRQLDALQYRRQFVLENPESVTHTPMVFDAPDSPPVESQTWAESAVRSFGAGLEEPAELPAVADILAGGPISIETANRFAYGIALRAGEPVSKGTAALNAAIPGGAGSVLRLFKDDPGAALQGSIDVTARSFGSTGASLVAAPLAGPLAPGVVGLGSASAEAINELGNALIEENIDPRDGAAVQRAMNDPVVGARVRKKVLIKSGVVGGVDALTAKASGLIPGGKTPARKVASKLAGLGVEMAGGAGGEAASQLASGKEFQGGDVLMEALAELLPGAATLAGQNVMRPTREPAAPTPASAKPQNAPEPVAPAQPVTPTTSPPAPSPRVAAAIKAAEDRLRARYAGKTDEEIAAATAAMGEDEKAALRDELAAAAKAAYEAPQSEKDAIMSRLGIKQSPSPQAPANPNPAIAEQTPRRGGNTLSEILANDREAPEIRYARGEITRDEMVAELEAAFANSPSERVRREFEAMGTRDEERRRGDSNEGGVVAGGVRGPGPVEDAGRGGVAVPVDVRPVGGGVAEVVGNEGSQAGAQPGDVGGGRPDAEVEPWQMTRDEWEANRGDSKNTWGFGEDGTGAVWVSEQMPAPGGWIPETRYTLTPEEAAEYKRREAVKGKAGYAAKVEFRNRMLAKAKGKLTGDHRALVEIALSEGRQVAPEVLADYPELSENAKPQQPVAASSRQDYDDPSRLRNIGIGRTYAGRRVLASMSARGEPTTDPRMIDSASDYRRRGMEVLIRRDGEGFGYVIGVEPQQPGAVTAAPQREGATDEEGHQEGRPERLLTNEPAAPEKGSTGVLSPPPAGAATAAPSVSPNLDSMSPDELKAYAKSIGVPPRGSPAGIRARIRKAQADQLSAKDNPAKTDSSIPKVLPWSVSSVNDEVYVKNNRDGARVSRFGWAKVFKSGGEWTAQLFDDNGRPGEVLAKSKIKGRASAAAKEWMRRSIDRETGGQAPASSATASATQATEASPRVSAKTQSPSAAPSASTATTPAPSANQNQTTPQLSSGVKPSSWDATPNVASATPDVASGFLSALTPEERAELLKGKTPEYDALPAATREQFEAAYQARDVDTMAGFLHAGNTALRREFAARAGLDRVPPGVKRTRAAIQSWADTRVPWRMTRDEFRKAIRVVRDNTNNKWHVTFPTVSLANPTALDTTVFLPIRNGLDPVERVMDDGYHRDYVAGAIRSGESVPAEVLKDYPDLAAKAGTSPPSSESERPAAPTAQSRQASSAASSPSPAPAARSAPAPATGSPSQTQPSPAATPDTSSTAAGSASSPKPRLATLSPEKEARLAELKKRLAAKLNTELRSGFDPELFAIGAEMTALYVEKGARSFASFARQMVADLGEAVKPYLKAFYNGARDMPGVDASGMDDAATVAAADIEAIVREEGSDAPSPGDRPQDTKAAGKVGPSGPAASATPPRVKKYREMADRLIAKAEALEKNSSRRFDDAPGAAITGGSGRRRSGLHKKTDRAIEGSLNDLQKAKRLREAAGKWNARADNIDPEVIRQREQRKAVVLEAREKVKAKESAERKAAPIINEDGAGVLRITADEWKKADKDYRGISVRDGVRVRTLMRGGALQEVFITDMPVKTRGEAMASPASAEPSKQPSAGLQRARDAKAAKTLDEKVLTRAGKQVTRRELVDSEIAEGATPQVVEITDTAAVNEAQRRKQGMDRMEGGLGPPIGNPNHPDTVKYRALEETIKNPPKKTEYRMANGGSWRMLTKAEYDYAVTKKLGAGEQSAKKENDPYAADIEKLTAILRKQVATETSPRRQGQAAIVVLNGEAPAVQDAVAKVLWEIAPEAAEYVASEGPIGMRGLVASAKPKGNWRAGHDAETDAFRRAQILEAVANGKSTDEDLRDVLGRLADSDPIGPVKRVAYAVSANPAASPETKERAEAIYRRPMPDPDTGPVADQAKPVTMADRLREQTVWYQTHDETLDIKVDDWLRGADIPNRIHGQKGRPISSTTNDIALRRMTKSVANKTGTIAVLVQDVKSKLLFIVETPVSSADPYPLEADTPLSRSDKYEIVYREKPDRPRRTRLDVMISRYDSKDKYNKVGTQAVTIVGEPESSEYHGGSRSLTYSLSDGTFLRQTWDSTGKSDGVEHFRRLGGIGHNTIGGPYQSVEEALEAANTRTTTGKIAEPEQAPATAPAKSAEPAVTNIGKYRVFERPGEGWAVNFDQDGAIQGRRGLKTREEAEALARQWDARDQEIAADRRKNYPMTLAEYPKVRDRIMSGQQTAEEHKELARWLMRSESAIKAELGQKTLKQLAPNGTGGNTKASIIDIIYRNMLGRFHLGDSVSYNPFGGETYESALIKKIEATTDQDIQKFKADRQGRIDARKKALENPETLDEFRQFIEKNGEAALSVEQRKKYDELTASLNKRMRGDDRPDYIAKVDTGGVQLTVKEGFHEKQGIPLWIVQMSGRVDSDAYKALVEAAKKLGGWWSSFKKESTGFQFKTKAAADEFVQINQKSITTEATDKAREENQAEKAAARLIEMADAKIEAADEELGRDRNTNTVRRARMADSAEAGARKAKQMAETLANIAEGIQNGTAKALRGIRNMAQLEELERSLMLAQREYWYSLPEESRRAIDPSGNWWNLPMDENIIAKAVMPMPAPHISHVREIASKGMATAGIKREAAKLDKLWRYSLKRNPDSPVVTIDNPYDFNAAKAVAMRLKGPGSGTSYAGQAVYDALMHHQRVADMGIKSSAEMRVALREYMGFRAGQAKPDAIREMERGLIGKTVGIDFFPTPPALAAEVVEKADIEPGMKVLEPSAGNGRIADAIKAAGVTPDVAEVSGDLRAILEKKGYPLEGRDFMEFNPGPVYDRIVMNPPFSNRMDVEHVRHAYDLLKPGGRIVAIMSEGPFFGQDRKASEFRDWLDTVGTSEQLPEGSFQSDKSGLPTTGVNARVVVIDKPQAGEATTPTPSPKVADHLHDKVMAFRDRLNNAQKRSDLDGMEDEARMLADAADRAGRSDLITMARGFIGQVQEKSGRLASQEYRAKQEAKANGSGLRPGDSIVTVSKKSGLLNEWKFIRAHDNGDVDAKSEKLGETRRLNAGAWFDNAADASEWADKNGVRAPSEEERTGESITHGDEAGVLAFPDMPTRSEELTREYAAMGYQGSGLTKTLEEAQKRIRDNGIEADIAKERDGYRILRKYPGRPVLTLDQLRVIRDWITDRGGLARLDGLTVSAINAQIDPDLRYLAMRYIANQDVPRVGVEAKNTAHELMGEAPKQEKPAPADILPAIKEKLRLEKDSRRAWARSTVNDAETKAKSRAEEERLKLAADNMAPQVVAATEAAIGEYPGDIPTEKAKMPAAGTPEALEVFRAHEQANEDMEGLWAQERELDREVASKKHGTKVREAAENRREKLRTTIGEAKAEWTKKRDAMIRMRQEHAWNGPDLWRKLGVMTSWYPGRYSEVAAYLTKAADFLVGKIAPELSTEDRGIVARDAVSNFLESPISDSLTSRIDQKLYVFTKKANQKAAIDRVNAASPLQTHERSKFIRDIENTDDKDAMGKIAAEAEAMAAERNAQEAEAERIQAEAEAKRKEANTAALTDPVKMRATTARQAMGKRGQPTGSPVNGSNKLAVWMANAAAKVRGQIEALGEEPIEVRGRPVTPESMASMADSLADKATVPATLLGAVGKDGEPFVLFAYGKDEVGAVNGKMWAFANTLGTGEWFTEESGGVLVLKAGGKPVVMVAGIKSEHVPPVDRVAALAKASAGWREASGPTPKTYLTPKSEAPSTPINEAAYPTLEDLGIKTEYASLVAKAEQATRDYHAALEAVSDARNRANTSLTDEAILAKARAMSGEENPSQGFTGLAIDKLINDNPGLKAATAAVEAAQKAKILAERAVESERPRAASAFKGEAEDKYRSLIADRKWWQHDAEANAIERLWSSDPRVSVLRKLANTAANSYEIDTRGEILPPDFKPGVGLGNVSEQRVDTTRDNPAAFGINSAAIEERAKKRGKADWTIELTTWPGGSSDPNGAWLAGDRLKPVEAMVKLAKLAPEFGADPVLTAKGDKLVWTAGTESFAFVNPWYKSAEEPGPIAQGQSVRIDVDNLKNLRGKVWARPVADTVAVAESAPAKKALTLLEKLERAADQAKERIKKRGIQSRGRTSGATTLIDDTLDLAYIVGLKAASAGVRGGQALTRIVSETITRLRADGVTNAALLNETAIRKAARAILRDGGGTAEGVLTAYAANREAIERARTRRVGKAVGNAAGVKKAVADAVREGRPEVSKPAESRAKTYLEEVQRGPFREESARKAGEDAGFVEGLGVGKQLGEDKIRTSAAREIMRARREGHRAGVNQTSAAIPGLIRQAREAFKRGRAMGTLAGRAATQAVADKAAEVEGFRTQIKKLADNLPPALRGRYLNAATSARTMSNVVSTLNRMRRDVSKYSGHRAMRGVKRLAVGLPKLTQDRRYEARKALTAATAAFKIIKRPGASANDLMLASADIQAAYAEMAKHATEQRNEDRVRLIKRGVSASKMRKTMTDALGKKRPLPAGDTPGARDPGRVVLWLRKYANVRTMSYMLDGDYSGNGPFHRLYKAMARGRRLSLGMQHGFQDAMEGLVRKRGYKDLGEFLARVSGTLGSASQETIDVSIGDVARNPNGAKRLTLGQAMYVYALDAATRAKAHAGQMFTFGEDPDGPKFRLTDDDFNRVEAALTADQKALVDEIKKEYDRTFFDRLSDVNKRLNGVYLDKVAGYWGIKRAMKQSDNPDVGKGWEQLVVRALHNAAMLQERTGGSAPIVIGDFGVDVLRRSESAATIVHKADLVRAIGKTALSPAIREEINARWGKTAMERLERVVIEYAGNQLPAIDQGIRGLMSNVARAKTQLNPTTWLRNISSVFMLQSVMPYSTIAKGMSGLMNQAAYRELMQYSPELRERWSGAGGQISYMVPGATSHGSTGAIDASKATIRQVASAAKALAGMKGLEFRRRMRDVSKPWKEMLDALTLGNVFDAAAATVAYKGYLAEAPATLSPVDQKRWAARRSTEAFLQTANTNDLLNSTGLQDDARSSTITAGLLAFTSDIAKKQNVLWIAAHQSKTALARATAGMVMSIAWSALVAWAFAALLGGDEDDRDKAATSRVLDEAITLLPGGTLIRRSMNLHGSAGVLDSPLTGVIVQLVAGLDKVYSGISEDDAARLRDGLFRLFQSGSDLTGAPFGLWAGMIRRAFRGWSE